MRLDEEYSLLAKRLEGARVKSVSAAWVEGQKFYHQGDQLQVMKRLLLPNPESEAFKRYARSVKQAGIDQAIREVTRDALQHGAKVKWCDMFLCHSITLVDTDKPSGWVHIESALPFSKLAYRPSYTVYKRSAPETVEQMQRIFDELWEDAVKAPDAG